MEGSAESAVREWTQSAEYVVAADVNATDDVFEWAASDPDHAALRRQVTGSGGR